MFERRLKVVLLILFALTGVLLARAAHLQVLNGAEWADRAEKAMLRPQWVETVRGRLLDLKGRPVAEDVASTDTMVDYRAVLRPPDPKWVANKAVERLRLRMGDGYRKASLSDRRSLRDDEVQFVLADRAMQAGLDEHLGHHDPELMDEVLELVRTVLKRATHHLDKFNRLWTAEGEALLRKPLKDILDMLDANLFRQIHRGTVVNLKAIASIARDDTGKGLVKLKNRPETLTVSRPFMAVFRNM